MSIIDRNHNIDVKLGIAPPDESSLPEKKEEENNVPAISSGMSLEKDVEDLNSLYDDLLDLFQDAKTVAQSFGRDRSFEVTGGLATTLINIKKEKRDTIQQMNPDIDSPNKTVNNTVVFTGSYKELMNQIPEKEKPKDIVIDQGTVEKEEKEKIYKLDYLVKDDEIITGIKSIMTEASIRFEETTTEDGFTFTFPTHKEMLQTKFAVMEKYGI